jgi:periplasmic protein TonB
MNEAKISSSAGTALDAMEFERVLGPPLRDSAARLRQAAALAAAFLLHAAVPLLFVLGLPLPERPVEPPSIPVELVLLPEPKAPPKPKVEPAVQPQPQAQAYRESGGDPDLAPGKLAEAKPQPKPEPAAVAAAETAVAPPETFKSPPLAEMPAPPLPVPRPSERPKANEAVAALPPARQPAAPTAAQPATLTPNDSALIGKGGGDRYLNRVRDSILDNLIYPGSAQSQSIAGVAKYEIVIDRQGHLLALHLLHSSGVDVLDQAGRSAVELSAPFGAPPAEIIGDQIGMALTLYIGPDAKKLQ